MCSAISFMTPMIFWASPYLKERMLPMMVAVSGMILDLFPPLMAQGLTTQVSKVLWRLAGMAAIFSRISAAGISGFTARWGLEPCPPTPCTLMLNRQKPEATGPSGMVTLPNGSQDIRWVLITSSTPSVGLQILHNLIRALADFLGDLEAQEHASV